MSGGDSVTRPIEILLVEDNPGDVRLAKEALEDSPVRNHVSVAADGEVALRFLRREKEFANAPRPDLILLDLKLPKKDGFEVLAEIKADRKLRAIPVVVLTTSDAPEDVHKAYDLQANAYVTKPHDLDEFFNVVTCIQDFCVNVAKLPLGPF